MRKAMLSWSLKNFNEAIASFDKALAIKPNNTKALSEKGDALLKR